MTSTDHNSQLPENGMSATPRTDAECIRAIDYVPASFARRLEIELKEAEHEDNAANHYLSRAEKAEAETAQAKQSLQSILIAYEVAVTTRNCLITELAAMKAHTEKAEAESNKLLEHGIQALMIARSWVMVWGDKLLPDSVVLFTKHEQEFLSAKEASK